MVPVAIRVVDNSGRGRPGYTVGTYFADGTPQWHKESDDAGLTRFSLDVLETHQFLVERNRIQSPLYPVSENGLCGPSELRYTLAKVIVHFSDNVGQDLGGYQVRVRRPGEDVHMYGWARPNGEAKLYLMDGGYEYQYRKSGDWSAPIAFSVDPPQGGPGGVADDQTIEHVIE
jgi:hypothetical protein